MDQDAPQFANPASFAVKILFAGRWSVDTLSAMRSGPIRFGQLMRMVPGASKKGLTKTLRDLEAGGLITRRDLSHVVLHIEYELKEDVKGSILALLDHLAEWGDAFLRGRPAPGQDNQGLVQKKELN